MVCPSGDTSSDIQVPSEVVKSTLRVVFKGKESGRWAARDRDGRTAAPSGAKGRQRVTKGRGRNEGENGKATGEPVKRRRHARTWVVDKSGTPCDHSPRANTNQRPLRGPGLPPRSFTVSGALTRRPGWK